MLNETELMLTRMHQLDPDVMWDLLEELNDVTEIANVTNELIPPIIRQAQRVLTSLLWMREHKRKS
jgi:hypothetical protein